MVTTRRSNVLATTAAATAMVASATVLLWWSKQKRRQRQRTTSGGNDETIRSSSGAGTKRGPSVTRVATANTARAEKDASIANRGLNSTATIAGENTKRTTTTTSTPPPLGEIQVNANSASSAADEAEEKARILNKGTITIVHGSMTGTCRKMAQDLYDKLMNQQQQQQNGNNPHGERRRLIQMGSAEEWDWWDELLNDDENDNDESTAPANSNQKSLPTTTTPVLIVLLPTYTNGTWTPVSACLQTALQEVATDWRVAQFPLKHKLHVAVLGSGSSAYDDATMGQPARQAVRSFQQLGAKCIARLAVGDASVGNHAWDTYHAWSAQVITKVLLRQQQTKNSPAVVSKGRSASNKKTKKTNNLAAVPEATSCACKEDSAASQNGFANTSTGCCSSNNENEETACTSPRREDVDVDDEPEFSDEEDDDSGGEPEVIDLEDMGDAILASNSASASSEPREMVTPSQAKALKKEGYRLIGTHSAVKLCRWTKHQLRGRGGCYKHTFYGITSYQCMEATPSLACANKCVFCWRHHKNPVGKEWRWKTDDPHDIVAQAVAEHVKLIKEAKGIPGVHMDRWEAAHTGRHCALSLVGEPIMYPRINELLGDLHGRHISTFLVTNGQHPAAIDSLIPITQLYVSVDAPTRESLIEIDRPLFRDAWERLRQSLTSLKARGQRTVARLTVVKGWNSDEVQGYAELIALGHVSLVEVKGVTFCGKSDASNLNMSNTPWHHEVVALTQTLKKEIDKVRTRRLAAAKGRNGTNHENGEEGDIPPEYDLACEHKHSCSVLLARVDQFRHVDPATGQAQWKTWIDYDKFQELVARHEKDPSFTFRVQDYTADTPSWALFGASEEGFNPTEHRHRKKTKHPKYTQFDDRGVPTHDDANQPLPASERERLNQLMEERLAQLGGAGSVVTELGRDGGKECIMPLDVHQ